MSQRAQFMGAMEWKEEPSYEQGGEGKYWRGDAALELEPLAAGVRCGA